MTIIDRTPPEPVETIASEPDAHGILVERAGRWLRNTKHCKCVRTEPKPWQCLEHPDAIGWLGNGQCIVIECKASLSDYQADNRKSWRNMSLGMGFLRYYMVGAELGDHLIALRSPGEYIDAGLLIMRGRCVKVEREAVPRQLRDFTAETIVLLSTVQGLAIKIDQLQFQCDIHEAMESEGKGGEE